MFPLSRRPNFLQKLTSPSNSQQCRSLPTPGLGGPRPPTRSPSANPASSHPPRLRTGHQQWTRAGLSRPAGVQRLIHYAYDHGIRFFETPKPTSPPTFSRSPQALPARQLPAHDQGDDRTTSSAPCAASTTCGRPRRPEYFDICCCTGSTPPTGSLKPARCRTAFSKRNRRRSFTPAALPCTVFRAAPDAWQQVA